MVGERIKRNLKSKIYRRVHSKYDRGRRMTREELKVVKVVLDNHKHWFSGDCENMRANLEDANLRGVNLENVNLRGANLIGANLIGANLISDSIVNYEYRKGKIATEDIIGYKQCKNNLIVTLRIPRGAIIFSINGKKCRTNKAKVIDIDGGDRAYSIHNNTSYYVGDEFTIYDFDCQYNVECSNGIHFFMSREEAEDYL